MTLCCRVLSIALVLGSLAYSASQAAAAAAAAGGAAAAAEPASDSPSVKTGQQEPAAPSALPEAASGAWEAAGPSITLGGGKIKLDKLGPAIVGEDGTLKRITNWDELSQAEKDTTTRRISARNKERLEAMTHAGGKHRDAKTQAAMDAVSARKPASSPDVPAAEPDDALDEIDKKYKDVYDFTKLSVEGRAKLMEALGDSGKEAFARRVAQHQNEKLAALTPAEREERRAAANNRMDSINPELRERLMAVLRDTKGGGGKSSEQLKQVLEDRQARMMEKAREVKRLMEQREELEARGADGAAAAAPHEDEEYEYELELEEGRDEAGAARHDEL